MTDDTTTSRTAAAITSVLATFTTGLTQITRANELPLPAGGFRRENDAEHSYELALVAVVVAELLDPDLDRGLVARLALVHDLEEVYCGDVSVYDAASTTPQRAEAKAAAARRVLDNLRQLAPGLAGDLETYLALERPEARYVYALDKILPFVRVLHNGRHHARPSVGAYTALYDSTRRKVAEYPQLVPVFEHVYHEVGGRLPMLNDY